MNLMRLRLILLFALLVAGSVLYVLVIGRPATRLGAPAQARSEPTASGEILLGSPPTTAKNSKQPPDPREASPQQESDLVKALEAFILSDPETKERYESGNSVSFVPANLQEKLASLPPAVQKAFELASYLPNRPLESLTPATSPLPTPEPPNAASLVKQLTAFVESDPETAERMAEKRPVSMLDPALQEKLQALPPDIQRLFEIAQYLPNRPLTESERASAQE